MTEQRRVIARVLSDSADHPDVEQVYRRATAIDPRISIATVYRTVRLFEEANILARHDFGDGRARYEEMPSAHHDHLIGMAREDLARVRDVPDPEPCPGHRAVQVADVDDARIEPDRDDDAEQGEEGPELVGPDRLEGEARGFEEGHGLKLIADCGLRISDCGLSGRSSIRNPQSGIRNYSYRNASTGSSLEALLAG